jgi:Ni/Co efflux regulator RcnB
MKYLPRLVAVIALASFATPFAAPAAAGETLRYDWRLRGPASWIARVKVPVSGTGVLQTSSGPRGMESSLRVVAGSDGYFEYQSRMDELARRTYSSVNGYRFAGETERKETVYDYHAGVARTESRDEKESGTKTRPLAVAEARDALTTIAYLRRNAGSIAAPQSADLFSDGKQYRVTIHPEGVQPVDWQGRSVPARVFKVSSAEPGAKARKGDFTIWLSEDGRRLPLRIVLQQRYAALDLRLRG